MSGKCSRSSIGARLCHTPLQATFALNIADTGCAHHVDTSTFQAGAGYAEALRPLIGAPAAGLFALGLIEAGAVAMLTISASTAYTVGEVLGGRGTASIARSARRAAVLRRQRRHGPARWGDRAHSRHAAARDPYERGEGEVSGYRNGYRSGRMKTAEGTVEFSVVSRIFRTFDQATTSVCMSCG